MIDLLEEMSVSSRIDAFLEDPPSDMIRASKFRCSVHGNNQGGHVFLHYIWASDPTKTRPDECAVCGNKDLDAHDG
jgi:hypothetical protein